MKVKLQYTVTRSARRSIAIKVDEFCNISVKAPYRCTDEEIEEFLFRKSDWLQKAVKSQLEKSKTRKTYTDDDVSRLRNEAKNTIPRKVAHFASIMDVEPTGVKINSAKKRYGSCSGSNSLNFSLYLMDKEEKFIDYVVIHELAHIKHHNHSKEFYSFVERFMPDYKDVVNRNK